MAFCAFGVQALSCAKVIQGHPIPFCTLFNWTPKAFDRQKDASASTLRSLRFQRIFSSLHQFITESTWGALFILLAIPCGLHQWWENKSDSVSSCS